MNEFQNDACKEYDNENCMAQLVKCFSTISGYPRQWHGFFYFAAITELSIWNRRFSSISKCNNRIRETLDQEPILSYIEEEVNSDMATW
jgi:hypothetical protein